MARSLVAVLPFFGVVTVLAGGCSTTRMVEVSRDGGAPVKVAVSERERPVDLAIPAAPHVGVRGSDPLAASRHKREPGPVPETAKNIGRQFASASLGDDQLGEIRGGIDSGSGVELSFAFQQATFINHNLVQNIVVPTLTVSPNMIGGGSTTSGATSATPPAGGMLTPAVSTAALAGLTMAATPSSTSAAAANSIISVSNGTALQISQPDPAIQPLLGSGATSIMTALGAGGLTSIINNTANDQLVQHVTTITIGINGLQQLLQQGVPSSMITRLNSATSAFR